MPIKSGYVVLKKIILKDINLMKELEFTLNYKILIN